MTTKSRRFREAGKDQGLHSRAVAWTASFVALTAGATLAFHLRPTIGTTLPGRPRQPVSTLTELLAMSPVQLGQVSIARMNLLCAEGFSASNELSVHEGPATVEMWAKRVQSETQRHWYRFREHPAELENSEVFFRMLMLAVVLTEDFGIHYDPQRKSGPANAGAHDGFFGKPRAVFLQGLLGKDREGTCSSLPVLYVAVGRQLGYPLKLVATKGHMFVRWEGAGERFNVEATGQGLTRFDDDYYRHWPFEVSPAEEVAEGYLKSLTPQEELAVFLSIRGMCLKEAGRLREAVEAFAAAARLSPRCRAYREMQASLERKVRQNAAKTPSQAREL